MTELTFKQSRVLACIKRYLELHGYPPSVRDIMVAADLKSTSLVEHYLDQLEAKGYIKRAPFKSRAIRVY